MKKGLTGLLLVSLMATLTVPVQAAEQTTLIHANVGSSYTLTIPKETTIDVNALTTPLNGTIKVTGNILSTENVVVSAVTQPLHNDDQNADLPYTLKNGNQAFTSVNFNQNDLKSYISSNLDEELSLDEYLGNKLTEKGISKSQAIKNSNLDRTYGYEIFKGQKVIGREKLIALCIGIGLNLTETQRALTIGKQKILYAKDARDSIIIFSINNNYSIMETNELLFEENFEPIK